MPPGADLKAILIHGNGGLTAGDLWLPAVERGLSALGLTVINQTFPDNVKARARYWLPRYFEFTDRGHFVDDATFPEVVDFVRRRVTTP